MEPRPSSAQNQNFIVLQRCETIAYFSFDNLSIVKGGMRYLSQLGKEAVELGNLEFIEIGKSWFTHFVQI